MCIVQGGEENIWCESEVGIEGCGRFCSELHDLLSTKYYHNHSKKNNTYVACSMHIVKMKGPENLLGKPEQEESFGRIM